MSTDADLPILDVETLRDPLRRGELKEQLPDNEKNAEDAIKGWLDGFFEQERGPADLRNRVSKKNKLFYIDEQLTWENPDTLWPEAMQTPVTELYWINNQYAPMVDSLVKEAMKAKAEYAFASTDDSVDDIEIAKLATSVVKHYQEKLLTAEYIQNEFKTQLFCGGMFRNLRVVEGIGPYSAVKETRTRPTQVAPGGHECPQCTKFLSDDDDYDQLEGAMANPHLGSAVADEAMGAPVPADLPAMCPQCGSPMDYKEPVMGEEEYEEVTGKKRTSDFVLESVDPMEMMTNSWAQTLEFGIWLRRYREIDWSIARKMHPNARLFIESTGTSNFEDDRSARHTREIRESYGGASREMRGNWLGSLNAHRMVGYREEWISPVVYDHYTTIQRETFPDGMVIESGEAFSEAFPDGMKICFIGDEICGVYNEDFHQWWDYCPYKPVPHRLYGKGIEGAIPLQEWLNELVSLIMTYLMEAASPTRVVDGRVFPKGINVGGIPSVVWRAENKPDNVPIDQVFKIFPPGQLNEAAYMMLDKIITQMQAQIGAWSAFGSGMPDAAGNTATGMSLMQEAATNLMATALGLRANADARLMKMILFHFRDMADDDRTFKIGGQYSRDKVVKLKGADLDVDIEVTVKEGSYFPRQEFQLRQDMVEYTNTLAQIMTAKAALAAAGMADDFFTEDDQRILGTRFAIPEVLQTVERGYAAAYKQIDKLKAVMADMEQNPDPMVEKQLQDAATQMMLQSLQAAMQGMGQPMSPEDAGQAALTQYILSKVPVQKYSDLHKHMANGMINWMNTEDGEDADPQLVQVIDQRIGDLFQAANDMKALKSGQPTPEQQAMMMQAEAESQAAQAFSKERGGGGEGQSAPSSTAPPGPNGGAPALPTGAPPQPSGPPVG